MQSELVLPWKQVTVSKEAGLQDGCCDESHPVSQILTFRTDMGGAGLGGAVGWVQMALLVLSPQLQQDVFPQASSLMSAYEKEKKKRYRAETLKSVLNKTLGLVVYSKTGLWSIAWVNFLPPQVEVGGGEGVARKKKREVSDFGQ